ncbi:tetratricopeptide repeat protein [Qipengyuania sp. ASV99]|uniref:tetratricopeptide repeat protein n=1 Tax=Qipengyuania sp. ASV99 TaxID=3399681 RepID=UPI003A4C7B14
MRKLSVICAALALVGCSAEQGGSGNSALTGSDTFLEYIDDARLAVRSGDLAEAGRLYDEALKLEPESPGLWVDIAQLRFRGGEHLIAIEAADHALQLDPQYAPALLMRAQLVRDANGLAESLPWFEAAVSADPQNAEALGDYAATLGDLGRYGDMLAVVHELGEIAPTYPPLHYLQAVLAARAGDPVLASTLLSRSGLRNKGVPAAMMLDAIVDLQQGNADTAAATLEQLAQLQPGNMRVSELLARGLWLGGRDREVVDRFAAYAERPEASPYLVMLVGRSMERMGDRRRAISYILRAQQAFEAGQIVLDGNGGGAALPAATAELRGLAANGAAAEARSRAEQLLRRFPNSGDVHLLAGDTALGAGDAERALELYAVAARVRRSWPLTRKIYAAYRQIGDNRAADVLLSRYIAGDPQNTSALLLLAKRSAQDEDWLRVEVLLNTAAQLGAGNDLEVLSLRAQAARALGHADDAAQFDAQRRLLAPGSLVRL